MLGFSVTYSPGCRKDPFLSAIVLLAALYTYLLITLLHDACCT